MDDNSITLISGTYFGSGTNNESRDTAHDIKRRVTIFKHLSANPGRERWAFAMGFIDHAFCNDKYTAYFLTEDGYEYWKDEDIGE